MPNTTLRLGVIGLGRAAASMLPSLAAHPHVKLTAAADPNADARARFEADFGGSTFETAEALCASGLIDGVYIASPHQFHVANVLTAAGRGIHAIVEKPMALTLEECRLMIDAAQRAGTVLVVGHSHGFDPQIILIRDLVKQPDIGPLRMIVNLVYTNFLYRPRRPEELDTAQGGGIMYNQIPHQIDIVRTIEGGSLKSAYALTGIWDKQRPTEGAMTALLEFESGVAASLTYSGYDHFDADEFHEWVGEGGETKTADYGKLRRALKQFKTPEEEARGRTASGFAGSGMRKSTGPMHHPHFGLVIVSCENADLRPSPDGVLIYSEDGVREVRVDPARAYPNKDGVIDEFYEAIHNGKPAVHDGKWGYDNTVAGLALLESSRSRRPVTVAELAL
jgi:phthalate 4,5-cis-dihydrodiol dehydrogenase